MKAILLTLVSALFLVSCAGTSVKRTYVATGATDPKAIYIRPFAVAPDAVVGDHGPVGQRPIRASLYGREFADRLQEQMAKMAPSAVLEAGEEPPTGWLIDGEFDLIDGGSRWQRAMLGFFGAGRSTVAAHVKVSDAVSGEVLYAFDVSGGSGMTGPRGRIDAPGLGQATPFDFRSMAEEIYLVLSRDSGRYGTRSSIGNP